MAAARLYLLTAEQLDARLEDALQFLTASHRIGLPRHQTLRATLDWSYQLLTGQERMLQQRLSVFAGGFTLEAAEAVCADAIKAEAETNDRTRPVPKSVGLSIPEILCLLGSLVAKSMVRADHRPGAGCANISRSRTPELLVWKGGLP
jgi:predicted ATPase